MIEMRIVGVRVEMPSQQPILMLTETAGARSLPILIGSAEATAIAMHLQGMTPPRPMTHDLFKDVLTATGRTLSQVRVTDFREGTFYGELVFDEDLTVSARPSDAVALAVRCAVPVFVADEVLDEVGIVIPHEPGADDAGEITDPESEVEAFREFLDNVSPEDFGPEGEPAEGLVEDPAESPGDPDRPDEPHRGEGTGSHRESGRGPDNETDRESGSEPEQEQGDEGEGETG